MRINSARGLLREFGIVFAAGAATFPDHVQGLIEDADAPVPMLLRDLFHQLVLPNRPSLRGRDNKVPRRNGKRRMS